MNYEELCKESTQVKWSKKLVTEFISKEAVGNSGLNFWMTISGL